MAAFEPVAAAPGIDSSDPTGRRLHHRQRRRFGNDSFGYFVTCSLHTFLGFPGSDYKRWHDMEEKDQEFSEEELEIVELPKREAMGLINFHFHIHNLFHELF